MSPLPHLKWTVPDVKSIRAQVDDCLQRTNWEAICNKASAAKGRQPCTALPFHTSGGSSLARLLAFGDGSHCVARVQLRKSTAETSRRIETEVATTAFLVTTTAAPVPHILGFELDDANPAGRAFVLLDFIPGNTAMEEARGFERTDWGLIPMPHRQTFYRGLAAAQASRPPCIQLSWLST